MQYALGLITGIAAAALIFAILAYFRAGIEKRVRIIETVLGNAGPKPTGGIFLPDDDAEAARKKHVAKNKAAGKDTPLAELYEQK